MCGQEEWKFHLSTLAVEGVLQTVFAVPTIDGPNY